MYCRKCTAEMRFKGAIDVEKKSFSKVFTIPIRVRVLFGLFEAFCARILECIGT